MHFYEYINIIHTFPCNAYVRLIGRLLVEEWSFTECRVMGEKIQKKDILFFPLFFSFTDI